MTRIIRMREFCGDSDWVCSITGNISGRPDACVVCTRRASLENIERATMDLKAHERNLAFQAVNNALDEKEG